MISNPYGIQRSQQLSPLEAELIAFVEEPPPEAGGLGKAEHFWRIVEMLWGPESPKPFVRHPWAERMTTAACRNKYLGVSACASAGKTDWGAIWGIVNWLCDPKNTLVLMTSTSLKESQKRIWGSVKAYWSARPGLPGKLVDSIGMIRTDDGSGVFNDKQGIALIAGEKKDEADAIGKIIGAKNKRVLLIGDELPELTRALTTAAVSNLAMNPYFQFIAFGNFKSEFDAFGTFIRPKDGYDSINVEDEEWETELGICLHLDGMKSPNIIEGKDKWPIYNSDNLAAHKKDLGPESAMFWRMCRSFGAPIGTSDTIYSEADLRNGRAQEKGCLWMRDPIRVSSLDPSFTNGGDRSAQIIGSYGQCVDGLFRLQVDDIILIRDDVKDSSPRDFQIARKFRDNCIYNRVPPRHAAIDCSGAGAPLWSIIAEEWSREVLEVNFSGSPSPIYVRATDTRTGDKEFDRRVSELWWVGREFMKYQQIKGINNDLARELKARKYTTIKGSEGLKVSVEPKKDMKKRLGFSPDLADSWCVLVDLCRQRFGFLAGGESTGHNAVRKNFEEQLNVMSDMYEHADYSDSSYEPSSFLP